jgi:hypothetical protein
MIRRTTLSILCSVIGLAQLSARQTTYMLKATPKTVAWVYYNAKAVPALHIEPELGGLYPAKRVIL